MQGLSTAVAGRKKGFYLLGLSAYRWRHYGGRAFLYLLLFALSVVFGFPFFWTVSSSLKTGPEWYVYPPKWLPDSPQWANYLQVFWEFRYPVGRWLANSFIISVLATLGTMLSASLVSYGFARFRFPGKNILFMITLSTMMIPGQVTLIPQFILFHKMHWVDTLKPLIVPSWFGGGAFYIFLLRQFFMTLPVELDEAARIDGAGYIRVFWNILLPLCRPVLATVGIIAFMGHWSDFFGPLVYLNTPEKFTIAVGLQFFQELREVGGKPLQHLLMAATSMSIIPCIVLFFAGQRYFVRGIVMTGLKG